MTIIKYMAEKKNQLYVFIWESQILEFSLFLWSFQYNIPSLNVIL